MLKAKDVMTKDASVIAPEAGIAEAARLLLDKGYNGLPVVDASGALVGILCQSDLVAQQKKLSLPSLFSLLDGFLPLGSMKELDKEMEKIAALTVQGAMTADPEFVTPDTPVEDVATLMVDRAFHTIPVVDGGKVVGVIGMSDILKTLVDK